MAGHGRAVGRIVWLWAMVVLSGLLFETAYFRWWPAVFLVPLPLAWAFASCRSNPGSLLFGLFGGFLALRIHHDALTVYNHAATNVLVLIHSLSMVPLAWILHQASRRAYRMAWVLPLAWVAAEVLRMSGPTGLPFSVLAFACDEQAWMIQITDLGGPLLLSLALAAVSGVALDFILHQGPLRQRLRRALLPGGLVVAAIWLGIFIYGQVRMGQVEDSLSPSLRVAVLQTDAIIFQDPQKDYDGQIYLEDLKRLSEAAASAPEPPDLILWPEKVSGLPLYNTAYLETPFDPRMLSPAERASANLETFAEQWSQYLDKKAAQQDRFLDWVDALGIPLLVGLSHLHLNENRDETFFEERNAASLFLPGQRTPAGSQFKMRLFPGAETLPGGSEAWRRALGWLPPARKWIQKVSDLTAGQTREVLEVKGQPIIAVICSEILFPESAGVFTQSADARQPLILTLANEGILQRNHSILMLKKTMSFRAVEARSSVARASNGGVAGFADPLGRYHGFVKNASGLSFTRLGAPELPAIEALLALRQAHGMGAIAADPALLDAYQTLQSEVERLRDEAGVEGFSIQQMYHTDQRTRFQRGGHHLPTLILAASILLTLSFVPFPGGKN